MAFIVVVATMAMAQAPRRGLSGRLFNHPNAHFTNVPAPTIHTQPAPVQTEVPNDETNDTLTVGLYRGYIKQYGWIRGFGEPISQETANHLSMHYRLSRKNRAGHWTRLEYIDAYGNPTESGGSLYIINPYDDNDTLIDEKWRKRLKGIVRWELVGDETGERCIQENAYDKAGTLVLSYVPVRIGENRVLGHYVDMWGMPVQIRNEEGAKYVMIEWDENGYEAEQTFLGDDGFPKQNQWGSYRSRLTHDKRGFPQSTMSCNVDGSYMIDKSGNCGQRVVYDNRGLEISETNYDADNQLIRVHGNSGHFGGVDYIQEISEYDVWGRNIRTWYSTGDGHTSDTTRTGMYELIRGYDEHGNCTSTECFGLQGQPVNHNRGFSKIFRQYDEWGNNTYFECRDAEGKFLNFSICLQYAVYDGDKSIYEAGYETTDGTDTVCTFRYYCFGDSCKVWEYPESDIRNTSHYDNQGRLIDDIFTHLDGAPTRSPKVGYHRKTTTFDVHPGVLTEVVQYYDEYGMPMDVNNAVFRKFIDDDYGLTYNRMVLIHDSLKSRKTVQTFSGELLLKQFQQVLSSDMEARRGEAGLDIMGQPARNHYSGGGIFYEIFTGNNIKGAFTTAYTGVVNEYGEPAYAAKSDRQDPVVYAYNPYGETFYMDIDGTPIADNKAFRNKLPRAYVVEVYDSIATTRWGIRSGDVVMQYGHWKYPLLNSGNKVEYDLREATLELYDKPKNMTVMRRNPHTNQPETLTIALGPGTLSTLGFHILRVYYTPTEKARYEAAYSSLATEEAKSKASRKKSEPIDTVVFLRPIRYNGNARNLYSQGLVNDAVVLGMVSMTNSQEPYVFRHTDNAERLDSCRFLQGRMKQRLWLTTDMKNIITVDLEGRDTSWDAAFWYNSSGNPLLTKPLKRLYVEADRLMDEYLQSSEHSHVKTQRIKQLSSELSK